MKQAPTADPRLCPAYPIPEAAHYLSMPAATLRAWALGHRKAGSAHFQFRQVLALPDPKLGSLSFVNLVEAHILDGLRRRDHIPLQKIRRAMAYLSREFASKHPLVEYRFFTDGVDLLVENFGGLLNISREGQTEMREILSNYLRRVEWDRTGRAVRLYLFTRLRTADEPRNVVVDPAIAFGRPVVVGTGVPTAVVAERYKAGDTIDELARDYRTAREQVEEAIRCELEAA